MKPVKVASQTRTRRSDRAAETRRRIIDAAGTLFAERGYAGATVEAIAAQADVAVETVYARFGSKRQLLSDYLDVTIAGDDLPIPVLDRELARSIASETDQSRQLELVARLARDILQRTGPAVRIMRGAAAADRSLEELAESLDKQRRSAQRAFLGMIAANGPLRTNMSFDDLADTFSALIGPESYAFLTGRCGWSPDRFERWVVTVLSCLLLPTHARQAVPAENAALDSAPLR